MQTRSNPSVFCLYCFACILFTLSRAAPLQAAEAAMFPTEYKSEKIDNLKIFYREAGDPAAPTIVLLHGFPSSSVMFRDLIPLLSNRFHLIAPDYPGFGRSDAPPRDLFTYTFDHLAEVVDHFLQAKKLDHYTLYMQDYGGPIGFRIAVAHPERVQALIIQNAVAHEQGLSQIWNARRAFWADRAGNDAAMRKSFLSLEATKQRHIGRSPHTERIDPQTWEDEFTFLGRPGMADIQLDLAYDYRNNVAAYPNWQAYLKEHQPPTLVTWGKYDPSFTVAGGEAYGHEVKDAEIHLLNAGHFALDEAAPQIADLIQTFMARQPAITNPINRPDQK